MDDLNGHQDTLEEDIGLQRNIGGGFDVSEDRIAGSPTMKVKEDYSSAFNQISEHSGKFQNCLRALITANNTEEHVLF